MTDREVLPTDLRPTNYNLKVYGMDLVNFTYKGQVAIDFKCNKPTNKISLNYRNQLKIGNVQVDNAKATSIDYDEKEVVTITLDNEITKDCTVVLDFDSAIQDNMAGFYRAKYQHEGKEKYMYSTQFEATDARCAFPCADEPNLKASFELSLEIPKEFVALANMPVKQETVNGDLKTVEFEKLPTMSTYLYAWAVGEFEYIEAFTDKLYNGKPLPVRVYTTRGLEQQGKLALSKATKCVDYFSDVFGIDYYLPKLDMLAVHEFTSNAMENTGLITYRTTAILFDEKTSDPAYLSKLTYVVCHEIAHQWFGNVCTMDWWDELWLNEGFATWVGWLAVDYLHPEWDVFSKFVSEALQTALALDASRASHPIEVAVKNGAEIDQIFDSISYLKGASTIRMLSTHLGVETFLKGVALYLKRHQYGNAKTTDLWAAVGEISGTDVQSLMYNWTRKIGFPVITVEESGSDVNLRQDRFLTAGGVTSEENQTEWWVPLALSTGDTQSMSNREMTIPGLADQEFFKLNKDQIGVYRVNYSEARLAKIGNHIDKLSIRDKIGLVADAASTAAAGVGTTSGLLTLIKKIGESGERSYFVWNEMVARLRSIRAAWGNDSDISHRLDIFCAELIRPLLDELDWDSKNTDFVWLQLRTLIAQFAIDLGMQKAVKTAHQKFVAYINGDSDAIHPSLKLPIMTSVITHSQGDDLKQAYDYVQKEMTSSSTVDGREQGAIAAGRVQDPKLIQETLGAILDGRVLFQDVHWLMDSLSANSAARAATWDYVKQNWDTIYAKYKPNAIIFERCMRLLLSHFSTKQEYDDIVAFFANKDLTGYNRGVEQSQDVVKVRYQWAEKDKDAVHSWLSHL